MKHKLNRFANWLILVLLLRMTGHEVNLMVSIISHDLLYLILSGDSVFPYQTRIKKVMSVIKRDIGKSSIYH